MNAAINRVTSRAVIVPVLIFFVSLFIFFITSNGNTPFNYFTRLAHALIHGRLYLTEAPSWLSELIPSGEGQWLVPYSPMPAFVALPFVSVFGEQFPQQFLAHILGAGVSVFAYLLAKRHQGTQAKLPLWTALLASVGTIMWFESAVGSSWYLGQITATFFLFAAIFFSESKNPLATGLCIAAAYLARVHTLLAFPFFLYQFRDLMRERNLKLLLLFLGVGVGVIIGAVYNYARFGVFWDKGYLLIPGVLDEPWFAYGIESPRYIPQNLRTAFWSFPKLLSERPYIRPSWNGLSIWITTPAFLFAFWAPIKKRLVQFLWLAILPIFLFVLGHGSNGFAQFGYRFGIDFYPFLIFLVILGIQRTGLKNIHWILLTIGIFVNLWGVLWINKFGWVGF